MHSDLEFGPIKISEKMRKFITYFHSNKKSIRRFLVAFLILTLAIIIKLGYKNVDNVAASSTAFTFDEPTYVPFTVRSTPLPVTDESRGAVKRFPLKESHVNIKAQSHNIKHASSVVREYLDSVMYECMPLRYFGVDYDIVFFTNVTLINPEVLQESDRYEFVQELDAAGEVKRMKRPQWIKVAYLDEELQRKVATLWGSQSYCFAHYEFL
jgi:hypothetical protein